MSTCNTVYLITWIYKCFALIKLKINLEVSKENLQAHQGKRNFGVYFKSPIHSVIYFLPNLVYSFYNVDNTEECAIKNRKTRYIFVVTGSWDNRKFFQVEKDLFSKEMEGTTTDCWTAEWLVLASLTAVSARPQSILSLRLMTDDIHHCSTHNWKSVHIY